MDISNNIAEKISDEITNNMKKLIFDKLTNSGEKIFSTIIVDDKKYFFKNYRIYYDLQQFKNKLPLNLEAVEIPLYNAIYFADHEREKTSWGLYHKKNKYILMQKMLDLYLELIYEYKEKIN
jgi:hypothetical protein